MKGVGSVIHSVDGYASRDQQGACDFTIDVTGEGVATAVADIAIIQLGAVNEGKSVQDIQKENAAIIARIQSSLEKFGDSIKEVATSSFQIQPQYDYVDGLQQFRAYQITHMLAVTLLDVSLAGAVIDAAVAAGGNRVNDVSFQTSNADAAKDQALAAAVKQAGEKAAIVAQTLGVSLSAVPSRIQELSAAPPEQPMFKAAMAADSFGTSLAPGQLTYRATVRAWYMFA